MSTLSPDKQLNRWLAEFAGAVSRDDATAAAELFLPDAFWRDVVAFTWNIHTAEGRAAIREMLQTQLAAIAPHSWQVDGSVREADGVIEAALTFETAVARCNAVIRLRDGRCWTLMTAMSELIGHEETVGTRRPTTPTTEYAKGRQTWRARREQETAELGITRQPYCLVVGAGQCGLALGARLKQLNVPTLIIDRLQRPSDTWRNRYDTLTLHSPVWFDHMPYLPFPQSWPAFPSKDQLANWLDAYATLMDLDIWNSTECRSAVFDEARDEWRVEVVRNGRTLVLHPKQLVLATSLAGVPNLPHFPGMATFKGEQHHASAHRGGAAYKGKRCVVVGSNCSGHDICAALWEVGADVTMVQRSPTIVVRLSSLLPTLGALYSEEAIARGITADEADLLSASIPHRLSPSLQIAAFAKIREQDAEFYRRLERAGFLLSYGEDESGVFSALFRRGSGYYVDIGASELIANGSIKLKSGVGVEAVEEHGLLLSDGSRLPADVIIYATGVGPTNGSVARILPREMVDRIGKVYGLGSGVAGDPGPWEGELRNMWKPTQQKSLWLQLGGITFSRFYSRVLALQIKARQVGITTPVYRLAEVHHRS